MGVEPLPWFGEFPAATARFRRCGGLPVGVGPVPGGGEPDGGGGGLPVGLTPFPPFGGGELDPGGGFPRDGNTKTVTARTS